MIIKKGFLDKRADSSTHWTRKFCVLSAKEFRYYDNINKFSTNYDNALGIIPLKAVYQVSESNNTDNLKTFFALENLPSNEDHTNFENKLQFIF